MVTETEKNSAVESNDSIVIKLPNDSLERILCFPFLHKIKEIYPKAEIHLISESTDLDILNLLPFRAYYHEFSQNDYKSILDAHRLAVMSKIFKTDLFISLTDSLPDATLGLWFRAKKRLGFSGKWKSLFFNQRTLRPLGLHKSEEPFELLKVHLNKSIDSNNKIISREFPSIIDNWEADPYIAIHLNNLSEDFITEKWVELISYFEDQKFIFYSHSDQDKIQLLVTSFLSRLSKKNRYENFLFKSNVEIAKMISFAQGVITFEGFGANFSAYCGTRTLVLHRKTDPKLFGPLYYLADFRILDCSKDINMGQVADLAHTFFRL
jgi:ADP-heptose:LPS heptosyltransferase